MFETKEGPRVSTYGGVNEDVYSWKQYNGTGNTTVNSHGLKELEFDLSDATLKGTNNHLSKMPQVVSRYQIRFDSKMLKVNAMLNCTNDPKCVSKLNVSPINVANAIQENFMSTVSTKSKKD